MGLSKEITKPNETMGLPGFSTLHFSEGATTDDVAHAFDKWNLDLLTELAFLSRDSDELFSAMSEEIEVLGKKGHVGKLARLAESIKWDNMNLAKHAENQIKAHKRK